MSESPSIQVYMGCPETPGSSALFAPGVPWRGWRVRYRVGGGTVYRVASVLCVYWGRIGVLGQTQTHIHYIQYSPI